MCVGFVYVMYVHVNMYMHINMTYTLMSVVCVRMLHVMHVAYVHAYVYVCMCGSIRERRDVVESQCT